MEDDRNNLLLNEEVSMDWIHPPELTLMSTVAAEELQPMSLMPTVAAEGLQPTQATGDSAAAAALEPAVTFEHEPERYHAMLVRPLCLTTRRKVAFAAVLVIIVITVVVSVAKTTSMTKGSSYQNYPSTTVCGWNQFRCNNGQCVESASYCNSAYMGQRCSDDSDRSNCVCTRNQFKCANGRECVSSYYRCSGYYSPQCSDGSDHWNCTCRETGQFQCNSGACSPLSGRCNRVRNCADGSDEWNCTSVCRSPEDTCSNGWCLSTATYCYSYYGSCSTFRCDGFVDCPDQSDELHCNETTTSRPWLYATSTLATAAIQLSDCTAPGQYKCHNGWCLSIATPCTAPWCSQWNLQCDGFDDCPDKSDEQNCNHVTTRSCAPGEFTCDNGQCVSYSRIACSYYLYYSGSSCLDGSQSKYCLTQKCNTNEFQCIQDGLCIPLVYVCDRDAHCPDASDEANCTCTSSDFKCANGQCVYNERCRGAGRAQCRDGSDRLNCTCSPTEFQCANGGCISNSYRCSLYNYYNCQDGSNQWNCTCSTNQFKCVEDGSCVSISSRCNGYSNCRNGSDEKDCLEYSCPSNTFKCVSDGRCVSFSYYNPLCNGNIDCPDGSDEMNCPCLPPRFRCANGQCIYGRCNGIGSSQCQDGSDRWNCTCGPGQIQCANGGCLTPSIYNGPCSPVGSYYNPYYYSRCGDGSEQFNCNCSANQFKCLEDGSCIPKTLKCNGIKNCKNGSDEISCFCNSSLTCANGRCVDPASQCDRINNCGDYTDEIGCSSCTTSDYSFTCNMGKCFFDLKIFCNGTKECPDGSDEPPGCQTMCPPTQYRCLNGRCVYNYLKCDGVNQCGDYSDENNCTCLTSQFKCAEAQCVDVLYWCDGHRDCPDGADELSDCNAKCPDKVFRCNITGKCLISSLLCNGIRECPDGSDEINCGCASHQFQCTSGTCITNDWLCDGTKDCPSGEDELECKNCTSSQFQCHSDYSCVSITQQCDGIAQCNDTSDESFCFSLGAAEMPASSTISTQLLSVTYKGVAGSFICSDYWSSAWSNIACSQMGFGVSLAWSSDISSRGTVLTLPDTSGPQAGASILAYLRTATCSSNYIVSINCSKSACGVRAVQADSVGPYIVNGDLAKRGAWPWHVSVFYQGSYHCGGSIVNSKWILIAAHCANSYFYVTQLTVRAGSIELYNNDSSVQFWTVDKVLMNPAYIRYSTTGPGDIALLRLTTPILYTDVILPICLPSTNVDLAQFKVCVATGFGYTTRTSYYGSMSTYLMQGKMNIMSRSTCIQSYLNSSYYNRAEDLLQFYEYSFCAGTYPGDISTCTGDGGGLACKTQQDTWTMIGVTDWTYGSCSGSVFTRVSTYMEWIQAVMQTFWN